MTDQSDISPGPGPRATSEPPWANASAAGSASARAQSGGPVGSGNYEVQPGDCIESIAFSHGHFWETVWKHPDNRQLKSVRKDPNVLLAGDKVFVPDLRPKQEPGATGKRHRFRRKGVPSKLQVTLLDGKDEPLAHQPYLLEIDGEVSSGTTDGAGHIERAIPPNAKSGKLCVGKNREREFPLVLGDIDPISEISGVQGRLSNLGFDSGPITGQMNEETRGALQAFQQAHGLKESGEPDDATRQKLLQVYGS